MPNYQPACRCTSLSSHYLTPFDIFFPFLHTLNPSCPYVQLIVMKAWKSQDKQLRRPTVLCNVTHTVSVAELSHCLCE